MWCHTLQESMQWPSGVMSVSWSFFQLCFFSLVISEKNPCGWEGAEWERGCTLGWTHCKWLAEVGVEGCCTEVGDSHMPSKLLLRSVQTLLPCTSSQPSRESKLHEFLKGLLFCPFFFFFSFLKEHLLKLFCYLK